MNSFRESREIKPLSTKVVKQARINSACQRCRRRKMRCTGIVEDGKCQGCIKSQHQCVFLPKLSKLMTVGQSASSSPAIEHPFRHFDYFSSFADPQSPLTDLPFSPLSPYSPGPWGGSVSLPSSSTATPTQREWKWVEQEQKPRKSRWIEYKGKESPRPRTLSPPFNSPALLSSTPVTETPLSDLYLINELPYSHWTPLDSDTPVETGYGFPNDWDSYHHSPPQEWPADVPLYPVEPIFEAPNPVFQELQDYPLFDL